MIFFRILGFIIRKSYDSSKRLYKGLKLPLRIIKISCSSKKGIVSSIEDFDVTVRGFLGFKLRKNWKKGEVLLIKRVNPKGALVEIGKKQHECCFLVGVLYKKKILNSLIIKFDPLFSSFVARGDILEIVDNHNLTQGQIIFLNKQFDKIYKEPPSLLIEYIR